MTHRGRITKTCDKWLRRNLEECAGAVVRMYPSIREFYTRLRRKRGNGMVTVAVAKKLVAYAYWILKRDMTYEELSHWQKA